jgi:hypothetical protein
VARAVAHAVLTATGRAGAPSYRDVFPSALRLLDREVWVAQARVDAERLRDEDLTVEPDAS